MYFNMDRRAFLRKGLYSYLTDLAHSISVTDFWDDMDAEEQDYFRSVFSCYPLLSEAPYELLVEAAQKKGIETTGKSKIEIARELFRNRRQ